MSPQHPTEVMAGEAQRPLCGRTRKTSFVCSLRFEEFYDSSVTFGLCQLQGCVAILGFCIHVRALIDEVSNDFEVLTPFSRHDHRRE